MRTQKILGLAAVLAAISVHSAAAQTFTTGTFTATPAVDPNFPAVYGETAQVGTKGASSADTYLDVEGSGNGSFETFGIVDFTNTNYAFPNAPVTAIAPQITLSLGDSPFSQTRPGVVNFYLTTNNRPLTDLAYDTSAAGVASGGVGTQLGSLMFLGASNYISVKNGPKGTLNYTFTLTPTEQSYIVSQFNNPADLNNGSDPGPSTIRFVVADLAADSEVASFTGAAGTAGIAPTLTVSVASAPEPSGIVAILIGMGTLGLIAVRRRTQAA